MLTPFLLWRLGPDPEAERQRVVATVEGLLARFLQDPVDCESGSVGPFGYLICHREIENLAWSRSYDTPEARFICLKLPANVLRFGWEALAQQLFETPSRLLTRLTFGYLFLKIGKEVISLQADAIGGTGCCIYERDDTLALASHLFLLRALDISVRMDWRETLIRVGLGAVTSEKTGFEHTRRLRPGERLELGRDGSLRTQSFEVIPELLESPQLEEKEALARFADEFNQDVAQAVRLFRHRPQLELSGGWDSRALAHILKEQGVSFGARSYGRFYVPDLILAKKVAKALKLDLEVDETSEYGLPDHFLSSVEKTNAWSHGHAVVDSQKILFNHRRLGRPALLLDGLGGELSRAFTQRFPFTLSKADLKRKFLDYRRKKLPPFYTPEMKQLCLERLEQLVEKSLVYPSSAQILGHLMLMLNRRRERVYVDYQNNLKLSPFYAPLHLKLSLSSCFAEARAPDLFPRSLITNERLLKLPHSKLQLVNQLYWNLRKEDFQLYDEKTVWKAAINPGVIEAVRSREAFARFELGDPEKLLRQHPDSLTALLFADSVTQLA